jgi:hypothetical protein
MKTIMRTKIYLPMATLLLTAALAGPALADDGAEGKENVPPCTLKTLKGRYMFAEKGTILPPAFGVPGPTIGADAGFHLFNGDGTGTDIVTLRVNGVTVLKNAAVPISYTVNADCTGTITTLVPNGPFFDMFISPNGEAIATIAADPGNYATGISQRVSSK